MYIYEIEEGKEGGREGGREGKKKIRGREGEHACRQVTGPSLL